MILVNLFLPIEEALLSKTLKNGLSAYTQANCQVTLTDDGYRIYRPPNITYNSSDSSTQTMFGGLKIQPFTIRGDILQQYHTYVIMFDVRGKTSNAIHAFGWSNRMGWGGGGLEPSPSDVVLHGIGANFNGQDRMYYKFTINDTIYKTCTASYSSFVAGNSYISYRDLCFGFGYQNTGSMGTDLYLTNFQMYDITNQTKQVQVSKNGIITSMDFNEISPNQSKVQFTKPCIFAKEFIEL